MQNESKDGVDRRDFIKTAVALVGATSAFVAQSGTANAQGAAAPAAAAETGRRAGANGTIYTGDVIQGKKVISALDVGDLARGKKHMFYFQGVQMPTGQHWYVSVVVVAELFPISQIFDNPAYPTLLANALIDVGIPAITPEIGSARVFDFDMIPLFVEGTMNVLKRYGVVTGPMGRTGRDVGIFVGNSAHGIPSTHGGFVELPVKLNDKVKAGQKVAIQRNAFGEVVAEYTTGVAGEVTGRRIDASGAPHSSHDDSLSESGQGESGRLRRIIMDSERI